MPDPDRPRNVSGHRRPPHHRPRCVDTPFRKAWDKHGPRTAGRAISCLTVAIASRNSCSPICSQHQRNVHVGGTGKEAGRQAVSHVVTEQQFQSGPPDGPDFVRLAVDLHAVDDLRRTGRYQLHCAADPSPGRLGRRWKADSPAGSRVRESRSPTEQPRRGSSSRQELRFRDRQSLLGA